MDATLSKNEPLISELYRGILRNCQASQVKRLYIDKDWANQKILQGEQRIRERDFTQNKLNESRYTILHSKQMNHDCGFFNKQEWIRILDSTKTQEWVKLADGTEDDNESGTGDSTRQENESNYEILQKPEMSYVDRFYTVNEWNLF